MKDNTQFHHELSNDEERFFLSAGPREEFLSRLQSELKARYQMVSQRDSAKGNSVGPKARISNFFASLRTAVFPIVLFIILFSVIGAVYAYNVYKGYLPGFGLADPTSTFRALPSPVSQTRDGVEVKVVSAISGANHTAIVYSISGIPASALPGESSPMSTKQQICAPTVKLILQNQTGLQAFWSGAMGYSKEGAYQKITLFETLPDNVNSLTLSLSCIEGTLPGTVPENWEIAFHLDPSPKNLSITKPKVFTENSSGASMASVQIDEVFQLEDGFLLIGSATENSASLINIRPDNISFTDKDGNKLPWKTPGDVMINGGNGKEGTFAFMVDASVNEFPISMEIGSVTGSCEGITSLDLDISGIPADGKEYAYAKQLAFNDCTLELTGVTRTTHSLILHLSSSDSLLDDVAVEASDSSSKIMLEEKAPGELLIHVKNPTPISKNPPTFRFHYPHIRITGPWTSVIELEEGG